LIKLFQKFASREQSSRRPPQWAKLLIAFLFVNFFFGLIASKEKVDERLYVISPRRLLHRCQRHFSLPNLTVGLRWDVRFGTKTAEERIKLQSLLQFLDFAQIFVDKPVDLVYNTSEIIHKRRNIL